MRDVLRPLLPVVAVALACMAVLDIWIRTQPLAMPHTLHLLLSVGLVAAIAVVVILVVRVELEDEAGVANTE